MLDTLATFASSSESSLPVPSLAGFLLACLFLPLFIRALQSAGIGQYIRSEGPVSHKSKAQTPTAGGVAFIVAIFLAYLLWTLMTGAQSIVAYAVLIAALVCGIVGLFDDLAKLAKKDNAGVSGWLRLFVEALCGIALAWFLVAQVSFSVIPFSKAELIAGTGLAVPWPVLLLFGAFLMAATTNAFNLHDGMDGLAAGTAAPVLATMALLLFATGQFELAALAAAAAGGLAAFLLYNRYPARIFMGDTGSLYTGGLMAGICLAGRLEFWFVPLTLIYILETLSVIVQVVYFKLTKDYSPPHPVSPVRLIWTKLTKRLPGQGKRFFRMAPLHHHFEAVGHERGWAEWQVVAGFWLAQILISAAVIAVFHWF